MRRTDGGRIAPKALIGSVFCLAVAALLRAAPGIELATGPAAWAENPHRNFGPPQPILAGRALLFDEADDPALHLVLAAELKRLAGELHDRQGWRVPFVESEPLRIFLGRREAEGIRRVAARSIEGGRLVLPSIELDASGMGSREIVRQVARLYAYATLSAYGVRDRTFLTAAAAEYLSGSGESEEERELARLDAAAPSLDLADHPASLGRLYVEEFARAAGGLVALRLVWEKASETGQEALPLLLKSFAEASGEREDALLLRFAARLYATYETEPAPSRVGLSDLLVGGLDAATPPTLALRHRTYIPSADPVGALRIAWPELGAAGATVVRYRDPALPPDVVFLSPGTVHTIPLPGVARLDWVVTGTSSGPPLGGAVALVEPLAAFPYAGLLAHAEAGAEGPSLRWTTASHEGLVGWAVFREEVLADGHIARTGPQILPSSNEAQESFRYVYVDSGASPSTYYRYTVWAVTQDGLLAKAFSATLRAAD